MINKNLTSEYCDQTYHADQQQQKFSPYLQQISALQAYAWEHYQRRLVVIAGERMWGQQLAKTLLAQLLPQTLPKKEVLWIADPTTNQDISDYPMLTSQQAITLLGQERDYLVYDAWDGFNPDAFGASCGTVRAGGLYFLLTPELQAWQNYADPEHQRIAVWPYQIEQISTHFLKRLSSLIQRDPHICLIEQAHPQSFRRYIIGNPISAESTHTETQKTFDDTNTAREKHESTVTEQNTIHDELSQRYQDQLKAINAIIKTATGHRNRPTVLTADRGRGKSTALGIVAGILLEQGYSPILVTAPRRRATEVIFNHACERSPELCKHPQLLRFIAPDELVATLPSAHLVLVDEAAAIPSALLETLLCHYPRIAFATTVHGYEGTGRGFAIRFQSLLKKQTPHYKNIHLQQPIRWNANDPLENFSFQALLMNAEAVQSKQLEVFVADNTEHYSIEKLEREKLAEDEATLTELFGLLVLAHYQTRPLDLRHLLDGPNIEVWVIRHKQHIIATALTAKEGQLDASLASAIYAGKRRPQGHLLPQSLSLHAGFQEAVHLAYLRIIRIAVHPSLQRKGLGQTLLNVIQNDAKTQELDSLGTSYAYSEALFHFWHQAGYRSVRIGNKRDTSSGAHSILMLKPLSQTGTQLSNRLQQRFQQQLPILLAEPLKQLESSLASLLLQQTQSKEHSPRHAPDLSPQDWLDCQSFAHSHRDYAVCFPALRLLLQYAFATGLFTQLKLTTRTQQFLVSKLLQQQTWPHIAAQFNFSGKKQALSVLRQAIGEILLHCPTEAQT